MAEVILNCPQCQRPLRITPALLGTLVKCPACGKTFTAPTASPPEPTPGPIEVVAAQQEAFRPPEHETEPWSAEEEAYAQGRAYALPAAVCLIVVSLLGIVVNTLQVIIAPLMSKELYDKSMQLLPGPHPPLDEARVTLVFYGILGLVFSAVICLASVQMARLRWYPLALIGCFLAMINFSNLCCIPGLPLGLWGFIVLLRSDVRTAFGLSSRF
jgi:hypothetical protein